MTISEYNSAIDLYSDGIFRFALRHLKSKMNADDIVQETFIKTWTKYQDINYVTAKSYLFTTAYHAILDFLKKDKRSGDIEMANELSKAENFSSFDLQSILTEALSKLPEIQKTVIMLRDYEGYNYNEIAAITKLTESQVKVYIFRGRQTLKAYLKEIDLVL